MKATCVKLDISCISLYSQVTDSFGDLIVKFTSTQLLQMQQRYCTAKRKDKNEKKKRFDWI